MDKYRLYFSKAGRARYISHLDLMRTFQRAFRRAGVHIRHTEGFNPHAFVSIVLPLSVGYSSACEILEFEMERPFGESGLPARMNGVLPEGITVHACYRAVRPVKELCYVDWQITLEGAESAPLRAAVDDLLALDAKVVTKPSKKAKSGFVELDIRPLIEHLAVTEADGTVTLAAVLAAQNPGLNPQLLLPVLTEIPPARAAFHRRGVLDRHGQAFR